MEAVRRDGNKQKYSEHLVSDAITKNRNRRSWRGAGSRLKYNPISLNSLWYTYNMCPAEKDVPLSWRCIKLTRWWCAMFGSNQATWLKILVRWMTPVSSKSVYTSLLKDLFFFHYFLKYLIIFRTNFDILFHLKGWNYI